MTLLFSIYIYRDPIIPQVESHNWHYASVMETFTSLLLIKYVNE